MITEYFDYRAYLNDWYLRSKEAYGGISFKKISEKAGLGSHSHFFDVLKGRSLSSKFLPKYIRLLNLSGREAAYFSALVSYEQSDSVMEKSVALQQLLEIAPHHETLKIESEAIQFFNSFESPALLQILQWKPKIKDSAVLAKLFYPRVSARKISKIIRQLVDMDMLVWSEEKQEWLFPKKHLSYSEAGEKLVLRPYHLQCMELGMFHYKENYEKQTFSTLTLATTKVIQAKINEKIVRFRKEIVEMVKQDPDVETVLQLNFQLFEPVKEFNPRKKRSHK